MGEPKCLRFEAGTDAAVVLTQWWLDLKRDRGERAALRRCGGPLEVAFVPTFYRLHRHLLAHGLG
jgi:hypothetical protein